MNTKKLPTVDGKRKSYKWIPDSSLAIMEIVIGFIKNYQSESLHFLLMVTAEVWYTKML